MMGTNLVSGDVDFAYSLEDLLDENVWDLSCEEVWQSVVLTCELAGILLSP